MYTSLADRIPAGPAWQQKSSRSTGDSVPSCTAAFTTLFSDAAFYHGPMTVLYELPKLSTLPATSSKPAASFGCCSLHSLSVGHGGMRPSPKKRSEQKRRSTAKGTKQGFAPPGLCNQTTRARSPTTSSPSHLRDQDAPGLQPGLEHLRVEGLRVQRVARPAVHGVGQVTNDDIVALPRAQALAELLSA